MDMRELEQGIYELNSDISEVKRLLERQKQQTLEIEIVRGRQKQYLEKLEEAYTKLLGLENRLGVIESHNGKPSQSFLAAVGEVAWAARDKPEDYPPPLRVFVRNGEVYKDFYQD